MRKPRVERLLDQCEEPEHDESSVEGVMILPSRTCASLGLRHLGIRVGGGVSDAENRVRLARVATYSLIMGWPPAPACALSGERFHTPSKNTITMWSSVFHPSI